MAGKALSVGDAEFEQEVLKSSTPVLVDFWAPWCGPCKSIGPIIDELAGEYEGKLKVVKVNIDDNPQSPASYDVRSIPTLCLIKDGEMVDQIKGAVAKETLVEAINKVV